MGSPSEQAVDSSDGYLQGKSQNSGDEETVAAVGASQDYEDVAKCNREGSSSSSYSRSCSRLVKRRGGMREGGKGKCNYKRPLSGEKNGGKRSSRSPPPNEVIAASRVRRWRSRAPFTKL